MRFATALVSAQVDRVILGVRPPPGVSGPHWLGCRWLAAGWSPGGVQPCAAGSDCTPSGRAAGTVRRSLRHGNHASCAALYHPAPPVSVAAAGGGACAGAAGSGSQDGPHLCQAGADAEVGNGLVHGTPQSFCFKPYKLRRMEQVCWCTPARYTSAAAALQLALPCLPPTPPPTPPPSRYARTACGPT